MQPALGIKLAPPPKRLRGKTTLQLDIVPDASDSAIALESRAADGLVALPWDSRRHHVHFTHVRTFKVGDIQPDQISLEEFWDHLVKCFRETYPDASSPTKRMVISPTSQITNFSFSPPPPSPPVVSMSDLEETAQTKIGVQHCM